MIKWNGKMIMLTEPDVMIESDMLNQGWGASCQATSAGYPWSTKKMWHINSLELLAATLALKTFANNKKGVSVLFTIDNSTAVAYVSNHRGTVSKGLVCLT